MFSLLERDHHRLSVLPATKKSTGEESREDVISHQSHQVLFSLGTTVLITIDASLGQGRWAIIGCFKALTMSQRHLCEFIKTEMKHRGGRKETYFNSGTKSF